MPRGEKWQIPTVFRQKTINPLQKGNLGLCVGLGCEKEWTEEIVKKTKLFVFSVDKKDAYLGGKFN
jgi:hypothetical protein